jgi:hypothetical protein
MADAAQTNILAVVEAPEEAASAVNDGALSLAERLISWVGNQAWVPEQVTVPFAMGILLLGLGVFAFLLYAVVRPLLLRWVKVVIKRTSFTWDNELFGYGVFRWATHLVPALMIYMVGPGLLADAPGLAKLVTAIAGLYLVLVGFFLVDSGLNAGHALYRRTEASQRIPVGTFIQVIKLLAALVALIMVIAILAGNPPSSCSAAWGFLPRCSCWYSRTSSSVLLRGFNSPRTVCWLRETGCRCPAMVRTETSRRSA